MWVLHPLQPAGLSNLENKPAKNIQKNRNKKQRRNKITWKGKKIQYQKDFNS